jgi:hypothetical protein
MEDFEEAQDKIRVGVAHPKLMDPRGAPPRRLPRVRSRGRRLADSRSGSRPKGYHSAAWSGFGLDPAASRSGTTQPESILSEGSAHPDAGWSRRGAGCLR